MKTRPRKEALKPHEGGYGVGKNVGALEPTEEEIPMKKHSLPLNTHILSIILLVNGIITWDKLRFFGLNPVHIRFYILFMPGIYPLALLLKNRPGGKLFLSLVFGGHGLVHGLVLLTLPMGMVFALTGSYLLALEILLRFYLPSGLAFMLSFYALILLRSEKKIHAPRG